MPHQLLSFRPEPVTALAEGFTTAADHLDDRIGAFASRTLNVPDPVGMRPEPGEALSPYREMTHGTATALREISADLRDHAAGLHHAVAAYQGAEDARAQRFRGK
ncbi:ESX-1 secretion-associated protein [Streptomyces noursei]|uniref:hypothetical protein n=1 Tax=Streptomyces noursei TaxID=1971 RepID=UPI00081CA1AD|nr:hypothetical protein SNOUR_18785 [Streptomyces noursei ATCC 11455]MCZ0994017.1 ESX-1 secretion-associated protein [Streptomyces noursei]